jgi:hypothetical protein
VSYNQPDSQTEGGEHRDKEEQGEEHPEVRTGVVHRCSPTS